MDSRESPRLTYQGQPIVLERDNWAQFKDAIKILCLKMGDAGMALYTGKEQKQKSSSDVTGKRRKGQKGQQGQQGPQGQQGQGEEESVQAQHEEKENEKDKNE